MIDLFSTRHLSSYSGALEAPQSNYTLPVPVSHCNLRNAQTVSWASVAAPIQTSAWDDAHPPDDNSSADIGCTALRAAPKVNTNYRETSSGSPLERNVTRVTRLLGRRARG